ncbi:peroxiredoxin family protein [Spirosoma linguale]|uniref:Alkyl hydroperoxide reductase/ Thiol specific antioxidant/ Mal allergen n=1 Tax=Spirosoma linguale (strain ATCC 33905 / DSM 74 / LMG 10896 / Claus 1) TaxID=504472 RepID=D2QQK4_SPILD|nr:alkyl hydroperoxide reductase/ Thiol specific antioxidant/ Mal allergen [Spirosoma linguale DSM 74]
MTLEFQNELGDIRSVTTLPRDKTVSVKPLLTGDMAPFFSLAGAPNDWRASVFGQKLPKAATSILDLINVRPLVVSFYCPCWGRYARPYLESLVRLNQALLAVDAELVVFSNESPSILARQIGELDFRVAYDAESTVARRFGVYSEDHPVWERISGISEDAFTPALYVIGQDRRIAYHVLDENFDRSLDAESVVSAVYRLNQVHYEVY